jgi:hypothetical protein
MSSELDPDAGRDDPSPNAPKSADLNDETSSGPKETSGQADEHQAKAAESQLPVARLLNEAGQRLDDGTPPEPASMSDRPDRTGTVESPCTPKAVDLDGGNSTAAKESSEQADEHRALGAEPQLPATRLLDDLGLPRDESPAPRQSMSSVWEPDVGADDRSLYAPKWVRDAASGKQGSELKSRLQELIGEPARTSPSAAPPWTMDEGVVTGRHGLPHSLEPTLMPEAWPEPRSRSNFRRFARFALAIVVAAVVALFVVVKFPGPPTIVTTGDRSDEASAITSRFAGQKSGTTEQPKLATPQLILSPTGPRPAGEAVPLGVALTGAVEGASVVLDGLAPGTTVTAGRSSGADAWRIAVSDLRNAWVRPPGGFAGPMDVAVELRLADDRTVDRKLRRLEWSTPPVQAKGSRIRQLDQAEIADLMKRGEAYIAHGDLAAARLVLQRAAEGGDPRATLTLAGTYDPIVLEKLGVQGFVSDIALARTWYERAKELGSPEAPQRLEMLASRER